MKRFDIRIPAADDPGWIRRGLRRYGVAAGAAALVAVGGLVCIPSAEAAVLNHIYVSYHGTPTCTITMRLYDLNGHEVYSKAATQVGVCTASLPWDPNNVGSAYVSINSGTESRWWKFRSTKGAGHDHCILVKPFGQIVPTGDETNGCSGN